LSQGVPVLDTITDKCRVERIKDDTFKIILTQGLNRQIRRMCTYLGYEVIHLKRVRIMHIALENLKPGKYRSFTERELQIMQQKIGTSSKTEEASR
jgi:23S rRNA pseudouridine2604 synthase